MAFPPELDALLLLSHREMSGTAVRQANRLISKAFDWGGFIRLMRFHHLCIPVWRNLDSRFKHQVPSRHFKRIKAAAYKSILDGLKLARHTEQLATAFRKERLRVLFLKGACLSRLLYDSPAQRQFGDIDLLISSSDFYRADSLLVSLGFTRTEPSFEMDAFDFRAYAGIRFHSAYLSPDNTRVELHWRFCNLQNMFPKGFDTLWRCRLETELGGAPVPTLGHSHGMIFLLIHGAKHGWGKLFWLKDIADYCPILTPGDWETVLQQAREYRLLHIFWEAFVLADRLYRCQPPVCSVPLPDRWGAGIAAKIICRHYASPPSPNHTLLFFLRRICFYNRHHMLSYIRSALLSVYHQKRFGL